MILWESFYEFSYFEYSGSLLISLGIVAFTWLFYDKTKNKLKTWLIITSVYPLAVMCWFSYWHYFSNSPYMVSDKENSVLFEDIVSIRISTNPYNRYAILSLSNGTEAKFHARTHITARDGTRFRSLRS